VNLQPDDGFVGHTSGHQLSVIGYRQVAGSDN
jgi:hypothetical protein